MNDTVLTADDIDRLGQAVVTLTQELWVMRDRQHVLEAALADAGVLAQDIVDQYTPSEALKAQLRQERQSLLDNVLGSLTQR